MYKGNLYIGFSSLILALMAHSLFAQTPVLHWSFEQPDPEAITGQVSYVDGVRGKALKSNELTTQLVLGSNEVSALNKDGFTVEAWIAPQVYPWNWCPIVTQMEGNSGFFFGINADGSFGLHIGDGEQVFQGNSRPLLPNLTEEKILHNLQLPPTPGGYPVPVIPLLKWTHLVGVYHKDEGIKIYVNGQLEKKHDTNIEFKQAVDQPLYMLRDYVKRRPAHAERDYGSLPIHYSLDGLIDEVKIYNQSFTFRQVSYLYKKHQPSVSQPLQFRKIPIGPKGPGPFGASHTFLKYDKDIDSQWRMGEFADVIVRFDQAPYRLVFWHGINFYPIWYAENGIGMMQEGSETWGKHGCHEAMMDRLCKYSHVRIIENTDARVVIHWRHQLTDIKYESINEDPLTGWSDWNDDIYTIYPDGVAARKLILWSSDPLGNHTMQQENFVVPIGMRAAEIIDPVAVTLATIDGDTTSYTWQHGRPRPVGKEKNLEDFTILRYNINSPSKHYIIYPPGVGSVELGGDMADLPWPWGLPWWNHWPGGQLPSDGRQTFLVDGRPSSTCVSEGIYNKKSSKNIITDNSLTIHTLIGMTTETTMNPLVKLSQSWNRPAVLKCDSPDYINKGYQVDQRCWQLKSRKANSSKPLSFTLAGSKQTPICHPAFVIKNYGNKSIQLSIDGQEKEWSKDYRRGYHKTIEGTDLIIYLNIVSEDAIQVKIH